MKPRVKFYSDGSPVHITTIKGRVVKNYSFTDNDLEFEYSRPIPSKYYKQLLLNWFS